MLRLIKEGDKSYSYGWLDKVLSVTENGQQIASFNYHNDGQIAQAIHNGRSEDFLWDGLALIHRGETSFINEPHVTGGNPVLAGDDVLFNDMLGNTLAVNGQPVEMTAFGETADKNAFFTGKPMIEELGYTFLFRNYNPNHGKWTTADPLGYPDGWNSLAYVNNKILANIDIAGLVEWFRPSGEEYATGIAGKSSLVNTGDWLSRFMDDKVPGGWQFAMFHDELVGDFEKDTILGHNANALWSPVNITTMPGCFAASISANLFETGYDASVLGGQYTWDALCWGYDAIGNIYSWGIETSGEIIGFSVTQTSCILNWCFNWVKQVWE